MLTDKDRAPYQVVDPLGAAPWIPAFAGMTEVGNAGRLKWNATVPQTDTAGPPLARSIPPDGRLL